MDKNSLKIKNHPISKELFTFYETVMVITMLTRA